MNQNICRQYTTTNSLDHTLKEFTTVFQTFSATMTTVMTNYTAQMTNFSSFISNLQQSTPQPTQPTRDQRPGSITQPPRCISQPMLIITPSPSHLVPTHNCIHFPTFQVIPSRARTGTRTTGHVLARKALIGPERPSLAESRESSPRQSM